MNFAPRPRSHVVTPWSKVAGALVLMFALTQLSSLEVAARPPPRRVPPNLTAIAQRHGSALVRLMLTTTAKGVAPRNIVRTGFLVSGRGIIVTTGGLLDVGDVAVAEFSDGDRQEAIVIGTTSDGIIALQLPSSSTTAARSWNFVVVQAKGFTRIPRGWLVGLGHAPRGHVMPTAGEVASRNSAGSEWVLDLPASPGSPILNAQGEVVAVALRRKNVAQTIVAPADRIYALLQVVAQREVVPGDAAEGAGVEHSRNFAHDDTEPNRGQPHAESRGKSSSTKERR